MSERPPAGTDRITVSMPRGFKDRLDQAVAAGAAPNVSSLVTSAIEEHLSRLWTDEWIRSRRGGRPIDPEALAWARRALGAADAPDQADREPADLDRAEESA